MRRARSAREIGWWARTRLSAIRRLISRVVPRVATLKFRGSMRRIWTAPALLYPISAMLGGCPPESRRASKKGPKWGPKWGCSICTDVVQSRESCETGGPDAIQADRQREAEHGGCARRHAPPL